jgi:hypothetical protein
MWSVVIKERLKTHCLNDIQNSVPTSQITQSVAITNSDLLILFTETKVLNTGMQTSDGEAGGDRVMFSEEQECSKHTGPKIQWAYVHIATYYCFSTT